MHFTSRLGVLACTAGLAALMAGSAVAQDQQRAPPAQEAALDEVVVTAQRREESLQDVPIAVTAINAESAAALGIKSTTDLTQAVTGLQMYSQNISVSPYIRGIGNKNTGTGDEGAVALYVDGVYVANMAASIFTLNNIERVEVLKGPQGTLFGRNAAAGVIQIITKTPQHKPSADISVGYGNYERAEVNFYATTGVTDNLATDLAIYGMNQNKGWGRNLNTGNPVFLGQELSIRNKWFLDLGGSTASLTLDYLDSVPTGPPAFTNGSGSLLLGGIRFPGFYNINSTQDVKGRTHQLGAALKIDSDLGWAKFVSISSYRKTRGHFSLDNDVTPALIQSFFLKQPDRTYTQEFQLLSPSSSKIQWIAGAYYFDNVAGYKPTLLRLAGGAVTSVITSDLPSKSYAAFGQATVPIMDATNLTAGLRFTEDHRQISGTQVTNGAVVINNTATPQKAKYDKITWRFALDHQITPDVLIYVSNSRGFKSGVFNSVAPASPVVRPQVVDSYEGGVKSEFLDHRLRLNGALFYNEIQGLQLQVPVPGGAALLNAAQARIKGAELNLEAVPAANLHIRGGITYLDSEYTSFPNAAFFTPNPTGGNIPSIQSAKGLDLIAAPHWTGNLGAQYTVPMNSGDVSFALGAYYNSGYFFDQQNRLGNKSFTLLNSSIEWQARDANWGVRLWGNNLGDKKYFANIIPQTFGDGPIPAAPRTFGVTLHTHLE